MKIRRAVCLLLCSAFLMTGCSSSTDSKLAAQSEQIAQLEQAVSDLQSQLSKVQEVSNSNTISGTLESIEGLSLSVEKLMHKVETTVPTGSDANRMEQYFDLKNRLKQLGRNITAYDDNLEIQYKRGTLSYTDYRIQEREAATLLANLDETEATLRLMFHMDSEGSE